MQMKFFVGFLVVFIAFSLFPAAGAESTPGKGELRIRAGKEFQPIRSVRRIKPGSALDFSRFLDAPAGKYGFVRAVNGRLEFSGRPGHEFRFYGSNLCFSANFPEHAMAVQIAEEFASTGYNIVRFHHYDNQLASRKAGTVLDPEMLERIDYFLFRCKENGIYIMLNAMLSDCGYIGVRSWTGESMKKGAELFMKFNILFDESARDNWRIGVGAFLTHRNPYTDLPLAADPLLAVVTCFNEQEFAFIRGGAGQKNYSWDKALPEFRSFLGDPDAPMFSRKTWDSPTEEGVQVNRFITKKWRELYAWYKQELRKMGYRGITTLWDMTKSMHYNNLRTGADLVTMHTYHAHVGGDPRHPSRQNMSSDLASGATQARYNAGSRITGRPFFLNEYATVFCNRCRYEESFSFAAFAAFQGYDGIMRHNHTIHSKRGNFIFTWMPFEDPVARASMTTAALMFARGDVSEGKRGVTLLFTERGIEEARAWNKPVTGDLSALAPAVRLGVAKETRNPLAEL